MHHRMLYQIAPRTKLYDYNLDGGIADQMAAQEFNINENGFAKSDIVQLQEAVNQSEFDAIASRLVELKSDNKFSKLSTNELLKIVQPRILQDFVETKRYTEYIAEMFPTMEELQQPPKVEDEQKEEVQNNGGE